MTLERIYTLQDVIDEALLATNGGQTRDVIRWLQMNRRQVLDDNRLTIEAEGLGNLIRTRRKKREPGVITPDVHNLCLDFGLEDLDLPQEISVPTDMENLPYCACNWPRLDDATLSDIDRHLALLDAQIELDITARATMRVFRQAAARVVPGRTDIPIRELRDIARSKR
jgi:hypothetical protein